MKRIANVLMMVACIVATAMTSCKDESNGRMRDDARIYINGATLKNVRFGKEKALSSAEIVRLDSIWLFANDTLTGNQTSLGRFSFEDANIDTIGNRLIMKAGNIDQIETNLFLGFNCTYSNFYLVRYAYNGTQRDGEFIGLDTLAYIPNQQRFAAAERIKVLWDNEDWDAIYDIFQNAFTFIPCTGAEFKELKEKGLN